MNQPVRKQTQKKCQCGRDMTADDAEFWGECTRCRWFLVDMNCGGSNDKAAGADRDYHGGLFHRGEW